MIWSDTGVTGVWVQLLYGLRFSEATSPMLSVWLSSPINRCIKPITPPAQDVPQDVQGFSLGIRLSDTEFCSSLFEIQYMSHMREKECRFILLASISTLPSWLLQTALHLCGRGHLIPWSFFLPSVSIMSKHARAWHLALPYFASSHGKTSRENKHQSCHITCSSCQIAGWTPTSSIKVRRKNQVLERSTWPQKQEIEEIWQIWCSKPRGDWPTKGLSGVQLLKMLRAQEHCARLQGSAMTMYKHKVFFDKLQHLYTLERRLRIVLLCWKLLQTSPQQNPNNLSV